MSGNSLKWGKESERQMHLFFTMTEPNTWFSRHGISADWAAVLGAAFTLVGAVIVAVITVYLGDWLPSGRKKRKELADTLNEFAHVLLGMALEVEKGHRPTQYGPRLTVLLLRLNDKGRKRIEKVALPELVKVGELEAEIGEMDQGSSYAREAKQVWVHDARALAGTLQGIAGSLSPR